MSMEETLLMRRYFKKQQLCTDGKTVTNSWLVFSCHTWMEVYPVSLVPSPWLTLLAGVGCLSFCSSSCSLLQTSFYSGLTSKCISPPSKLAKLTINGRSEFDCKSHYYLCTNIGSFKEDFQNLFYIHDTFCVRKSGNEIGQMFANIWPISFPDFLTQKVSCMNWITCVICGQVCEAQGNNVWCFFLAYISLITPSQEATPTLDPNEAWAKWNVDLDFRLVTIMYPGPWRHCEYAYPQHKP
jgi:hypothetical protein